MLETALVIGHDNSVLWAHIPPDRTVGSLPHSDFLWRFLKINAAKIQGIAHTHPHGVNALPSGTDWETFQAVDNALGVRFKWWVDNGMNISRTVKRSSLSNSSHDYSTFWEYTTPVWAWSLRILSDMPCSLPLERIRNRSDFERQHAKRLDYVSFRPNTEEYSIYFTRNVLLSAYEQEKLTKEAYNG